jgi:hypothetical protein
MTTWQAPQEIHESVYYSASRVKHLAPAKNEIPAEFWPSWWPWAKRNPWVRIAETWLLYGVSFDGLTLREGISYSAAYRHLATVCYAGATCRSLTGSRLRHIWLRCGSRGRDGQVDRGSQT